MQRRADRDRELCALSYLE